MAINSLGNGSELSVQVSASLQGGRKGIDLGECCSECSPNGQGEAQDLHGWGKPDQGQNFTLPRPPLLYRFLYKAPDYTKWLKAMPKSGISK